MTCAASTSSVVSAAAVARFGVGRYGGTGPVGWITFSDGGAGRPNSWSKYARSCSMDGEPNGSTMTIVWPRPSMPRRSSGFTS